MERIKRRYGEATTIDFVLWAPDGTALVTDAVHAAGDTRIMKDEGAEANSANGFADEGVGYSIQLTAAEMQARRIMLYIIDQGTKAWLDKVICIETFGHPNAQYPEEGIALPHMGVAQAGAAGSITLAASASASDNEYRGQTIYIVSGTGAGQARTIPSYVGASKVASVDPNWVTTPDATSVYVLLPTPPAPAGAANLPAVNTAAWAGQATTPNDIAIRTTLDKGTHILGFNDLSAAQVNAQVDAAIADAALATAAGLATVGGYIDTEMAAALAILQRLDTTIEQDGAVYRFTSNALEQAPTGGGASAAQIADAVLQEAVSDHAGIAGSLAAILSGRSSQATVDALTVIANAIKAKTDALPSDPADHSILQSMLSSILNAVDTEVAAMLAVLQKLDTALESDGSVYRFTSNALEQAPTGGGATAQAIADAVLTEVVSDHSGVPCSLASVLAARASQASVDAVNVDTDAIIAAIGGLNNLTATEVRDAIFAKVVDGLTFNQAFGLMMAVLLGNANGMNTSTGTFRNFGNTINRVIAAIDGHGNRTLQATDLTGL